MSRNEEEIYRMAKQPIGAADAIGMVVTIVRRPIAGQPFAMGRAHSVVGLRAKRNDGAAPPAVSDLIIVIAEPARNNVGARGH